jgi:hypothetical protein
MEPLVSETREHTSSSRLLEDLLGHAPAGTFTLAWLMDALHQRSFGVIILLLGLLATIPVGSTIPGLLLAAVAVQMIAGRREIVFPAFITTRNLPTRYLHSLGARAVPLLRTLEKAVHPRWPHAFMAGKRLVGITVLLLTAILLLMPVPLSNIAPAIVIAGISLAYIEEDGLLLMIALAAALVLIALALAAVWGTVAGAVMISEIL